MFTHCKAIIAIKFGLNICPKCKKAVKSTNSLIKYVHACKISIILSFCPFLNLEYTLKYKNIFNFLDMPLDNNEKNFRPANINKQKLVILSNFTLQNGLLIELSSILKKTTFSKSEFFQSISVLKTRYKYLESLKKNFYYSFND